MEGIQNFYFASNFDAVFIELIVSRLFNNVYVDRFPLSLMVSKINTTERSKQVPQSKILTILGFNQIKCNLHVILMYIFSLNGL